MICTRVYYRRSSLVSNDNYFIVARANAFIIGFLCTIRDDAAVREVILYSYVCVYTVVAI